MLDIKGKKRLKVQRVKELIDREGPQSSRDLGYAAGYDMSITGSKDYGAGVSFVKDLREAGVIVKAPGATGHKCYVYKGTTHTATASLRPASKTIHRRYTVSEIEALAVEYVWKKDNNDLRQFIAHLHGIDNSQS